MIYGEVRMKRFRERKFLLKAAITCLGVVEGNTQAGSTIRSVLPLDDEMELSEPVLVTTNVSGASLIGRTVLDR